MLAALTRVSLLQPLGLRPFALVWMGQGLSRVGDHLYELALAWWVLQKTGSAAAAGLVLICAFTPMLLFLLLGGVAGDRWPRVRLMFLSDVCRGALVAAVAALAFADLLQVWHIYLASLVFGFVDAFFQPAYAAAVPDLVPEPLLPGANALTSLSVQGARILGPAAGAGILAVGGTPAAFALNAVSFFLAALCLVPLLGRAEAPGHAEPAPSSVLLDVREAARFVRGTPVLWLSIIIFALSNITLAGPYSVALPFLVQDHLRADVGTLGFLYTMFPIGYLAGGVLLGGRSRVPRRGLLMAGGLMLAGATLGLFGLTLPVAVLAVAAAINGMALEAASLAWTSTLQEVVPRDQLGRVASIDMLGSYALIPIGYGLTGWATDGLGAAPVFALGGALTILVAGLALAQKRMRAWE